MYEWLIIMNNGNRYIIKTHIREVNKLINTLFDNEVETTLSDWTIVNTSKKDKYNNIVFNSKYISEILYNGVVK